MSAPRDMFEQAKLALSNAYTPYANFPVGACIRTINGQLFAGCNAENASYSLTLCAESSAIGKMISSLGQQSIAEILIVIPGDQLCPPCGACRQRLHEFATDDTLVHLCTLAGKHKMIKLAELLPYPFGSELLEV